MTTGPPGPHLLDAMLAAGGAGLALGLRASTHAWLQASRRHSRTLARVTGAQGIGYWRSSASPGPPGRRLSLSAAAVVNSAPRPLQPYLRLMRLDKPIGECACARACVCGLRAGANLGCRRPSLLGLLGAASFHSL